VIANFTRRDVLAYSAAILGAHRSQAARAHITKSRIGAITDEIGPTQTDAIAFAKQHGLQWVELRSVPESKKEFAFLTEPELKRYAAELAANRLKGLSDSPDHIDWRALLEAMERDGYPGQISVATEVFDGTFEKANDSVREVMHIVGELA
jgi:hypothetical protein